MSIRFACPHCDAEYTVHDQSVGAEIACPACSQPLIVPFPPPAPQPTTPPAAPIVVYLPPPADVNDYPPVRRRQRLEPREERIRIRKEVRLIYREQGSFSS